MASSGITGRVFCLLLLALVRKGATQGSGEGGLDLGCTRLSDTSYTRLHQTGRDITLRCPRQCSNDTPIWYHTLQPNSNSAVTETHYGPELVLSFTKPPTRNSVGYFCCACAGEHPKYNSCCFGVGYSPEVFSFRTTHEKTEVKGLYVGQSVQMKCAVYGYPGKDTVAEIVGPPGIIATCEPVNSLYEAVCTVDIPQVTVDHSGLYTCQGVLTITQAGETGQERSDDVLRKELVVYEPPTITNLGQEDSADDDSVTFVCTVECSIDFQITWLHNRTRLNITEDGKYQTFNSGSNQHKLRVLLTSTSDVGGYTCVINTAFKLNESARSIGFWITAKEYKQLPDLPGPQEEQELSSKVISVIIVLSVTFVVIITALISISVRMLKVYRANRAKIESERRSDEVHVPLQPRQEEAGDPEIDSLSDTDSDGPSHLREEDREIFRSVEVIKGPTALRLRRQPLQSS